MAAQQKQLVFKINLLIQKGVQTKLYIKLLRWLLSSGRFIVVIVELVVITAFVARYKLDADLANLQEKIQEQVPYLKSLEKDEKAVRLVQFQLSSIRQARADNPRYDLLITKISSLTPQNIRLSSIVLDHTKEAPAIKISLSGQTSSNLGLSAYVKALKKDPNFTEVALANVAFEEITTFTITAIVRNPGVLQNGSS